MEKFISSPCNWYSRNSEWKRNEVLNEEFFNPALDYFNATHLVTEIFDR